MKHAFALLLPLLVIACSHPLEIEGEGDIGSGRGNQCTLEQQPCANVVAGDYIRTYVGRPRPGWDFERWEGCGTQYPNCSFNVPASIVNQYWFQTMPPLRAVFSLVPQQALTDTGITLGGYAAGSFGNTPDCNAYSILPQDCRYGRDATHNYDADGHAGFSYTKLASDGSELPAGAGNWSCVRDNVTGRVWEVKTDDGGIHDKDNTYRWGGMTALGTGYGIYYADWNTLVAGSNSEVLCGFADWRLPSPDELRSLVNFNRSNPAIDTTYFPNTLALNFWTSSAGIWAPGAAWSVDFNLGNASAGQSRLDMLRVRLVRAD